MNSPSLPRFEHEIGARLGRGDLAGAAAAAADCRRAWPESSAGWLFGSIVMLLAGEKTTGLDLVQEWLAREPGDIQCLIQQAECLLALGRRSQAMEAIATATTLASGIAPALNAIGEFLVHAGDHVQALEIYDRVLELDPKDSSILSKRAVIHRFLGNFDLAVADYDQALTLAPHDTEALKGLTELRSQSSDRNSVAAMEAGLAAVPTGSKDAATLHFGLAKSYEDLENHDASWRHLVAGNTIQRSWLQYDPATDRAFMERIKLGFPEIETLAPDTTDERPIFILGLPRSGTTLVERIMSSHSSVHAAGELPALSEAISAAAKGTESPSVRNWLDLAAAIPKLDAASVAREYLTLAVPRTGAKPRFIDKQPVNFLYCGLILRAFPNAAIVHVTRHPLAACYAIYKTRFGGTYPFAYDLNEIAEFYIGYRRLMAHWHQVLPGRILDVAYEDVVTSQEATTRRLLDFSGLPFENACLDFHLNPAPTATASSVQVRQPLYDSSLNQWRHYAQGLTPVRERLEKAGIPID
jgi:hypothetical protein